MRLEGRRVVAGRAEGEALATDRPLSFLGGVDPDTGVVREAGQAVLGASMAGRVLVMPRAKGSTVGSYVLYSLRRRGVAPAAVVAGSAETILAVGAVLAEVPTVDLLPTDLFRTGDRVVVDAGAAAVELPDVRERHVVTSFLERGDRVLLVRRSERVGSFRGKWSGVAGYLEGDEDPEARARTEVEEETGITGIGLVQAGEVVRARGEGDVVYAIHPFRFHAPQGDVRLDWENVEYRWIDPVEMAALDAVPKLIRAYRAADGLTSDAHG